jgi:mono/diheme cytochrome c family protein
LAIAVFVACALPSFADEAGLRAFVRTNCSGCHNEKVASAGLNFSAYADARTFVDNRAVWERVLAKVKAGEMPPPGMSQPAAADIAAVTGWLESEFARQDAVKRAVEPVAARRLNRAEYNNTVRDLLGINIHPADDFPQDQAAFGFDDISDALRMSSALLEKYADAAELSVRTAIFGPPKLKPSMTHYPLPVRLNDARGKKTPIPDAAHYDLTGLSTLHAAHAIHDFPVDGTYSFRLVLNGHRPNQSMPAHVGFWIDGKLMQEIEVDATDLEGQVREVRTKVTAGEHLLSASYLKQFHGLPPSYNGPEPSTRPPEPLINPRGALTEKDIETLRRLGTTIKTDGIETRIDNRFESIDVGGPFDQTTGPSPESIRRIFVCGRTPAQQNAACARRIVASFAERAFRRPLQPKEADPWVSLYALARKQGDSFEEGIAAALEGVMVSPNFLYRIERDQPDYEMASRLSYFIWSSMPDAELLRLAGEHRLRQPLVLEAQVRRMLKDEKARALVDNFAGQWLQFRNIEVVRPDGQRFPDFDESLRYSMKRETELFVENIVRQDGSVLDFLDANYSFLDERLARFYGVPGVTGPEFRKVDMSATDRGGGILAQASILTISSYATRTSPVLRGKWILENLLNAPPPPPPPSVPALDDTKVGEAASLRQQMEAHRQSAVCASCHAKMDPLGFGLENLNAIGAWREVDGKFPVDSSGMLPDGRSFRGPRELKALLMAGRDAFEAGLTEKLMTYALGRGLERYDKPALEAIEASLPAHDYRFSQLVIGVVESAPFEMKRAREAAPLPAVASNKLERTR